MRSQDQAPAGTGLGHPPVTVLLWDHRSRCTTRKCEICRSLFCLLPEAGVRSDLAAETPPPQVLEVLHHAALLPSPPL